MFEALLNKTSHVIVIEGVIGHLAVAAKFHKPRHPEKSELVRDRRLRQADNRGNVADAELRYCQGSQDFNPRGIPERLEKLREPCMLVGIAKFFGDTADLLLIHTYQLASVMLICILVI